jgi:CheY-like chemotaxis protein
MNEGSVLRALSRETKALIIVSEFEARRMPMFQLRSVLNELVSGHEERKVVIDLVENDLKATGYHPNQITAFLQDLLGETASARDIRATRRLRSPFALGFEEEQPGGGAVPVSGAPAPEGAAPPAGQAPAPPPPDAPAPPPGAPTSPPPPGAPAPPHPAAPAPAGFVRPPSGAIPLAAGAAPPPAAQAPMPAPGLYAPRVSSYVAPPNIVKPKVPVAPPVAPPPPQPAAPAAEHGAKGQPPATRQTGPQASPRKSQPTFFFGSRVDGLLSETAASATEAKKKILLADDDKRIRIVFRMALERLNCIVIEAGDGHEAWKILQEGGIDLAVLDMKMPGLHGLEVLSRMVDKHITPPVIICSAYDQLKDEFLVASYPRLRYLVKPVAAEALESATRELLEMPAQ